MNQQHVQVTSPFAAGNCPTISLTVPILISAASLLGCFYVIVSYIRVPALRQHPAGVMFGMSVYCAIYQFLFLLQQSSGAVQCGSLGVFADFFLTGQETYMLIFAIDLLLALKNPFSTSAGHMKRYHVFGGLWSLLCTGISHLDTNYALFSFCWVTSSRDVAVGPSQAETLESQVTTNVSATSGIFFALYIVVVYCTSLVAILRTWNAFMKGLRDTFRTRQRIQRHLKYYVGFYFSYWTLVLACYGVFSLVPEVEGTSETEEGGTSNRCQVWKLLSCLLMGKGMVNALIWTRTSNILKIIEQLRVQGYVDLPPHEDSINWALRLEILTNTTKGICQSVERCEQQARLSDMTPDSTCSVDVNVGSDGGNGDEYTSQKRSYAQIEELTLETRGERGPRSDRVIFYDYAPHIFRKLRVDAKVSAESYRRSLEQTTKESVSEGKSGAFFYFTQDRKYVVKTLTREELKFFLSILPKYYTHVRKHPNTFVTRFFGCHGLTMYGKTVFFVVMQSVFDTTLQIHERFDLKGSWVGRLEGRKPTGTLAHCKYCGAKYTVGGSHGQLCDVRRGEGLRHQYDQVGKDLNWNRHMALPLPTARAVALQLTKDSDFLARLNCIDYSLLVGIHHRTFNVSHFSSAENFELPPASCSSSSSGRPSCNSFVSLRSRASAGNAYAALNQRPETGASKPFHQAIQGGMSVDEVHGPGIYYLGLIDILQQWNFRKRLEHFIRVYVLMQDSQGISIVNPKQYAERFQRRVVKELVHDIHADMEDAAAQREIQEYQHAQLMESGRTLSTLLNSFDLSSGRYISPEANTPPTAYPDTPRNMLPTVPVRMSSNSTARIYPPMPRRRAATTGTAPGRHLPAYHDRPGVGGDNLTRMSGGFVMEAPVAYRPSLNMMSSSPSTPSFDGSPNFLRPLASLTPCGSLMSMSTSESNKSQGQRPSSILHDTPSSKSSLSSGHSKSTPSFRAALPPPHPRSLHGESGSNSTSGASSPFEGSELDTSRHAYQIVQTPTVPEKNPSV